MFLSCATSALNQYQEVKIDSLMQRTQNRPLVSKFFSKKDSIIIFISLGLISFLLIYTILGFFGLWLFLGTIILYNGIYVYLKKKTYYTLVIGSILGVIPPLAAWVLNNQSLYDSRFIYLAFMYFIWQMPHFWLLSILYKEDYKRAGIPTFFDELNIISLCRISFIWIVLTIISLINVVYIFKTSNIFILSIIIFLSLSMFYISLLLLNKGKIEKKTNIKKIFVFLNIYITFAMLFCVVDKFI